MVVCWTREPSWSLIENHALKFFWQSHYINLLDSFRNVLRPYAVIYTHRDYCLNPNSNSAPPTLQPPGGAPGVRGCGPPWRGGARWWPWRPAAPGGRTGRGGPPPPTTTPRPPHQTHSALMPHPEVEHLIWILDILGKTSLCLWGCLCETNFNII